MELRPEIVGIMMQLARQIAAHEALVAEATQCVGLLESLGEKRCKNIIQSIIATRRSEIADMRSSIERLANLLVDMPI